MARVCFSGSTIGKKYLMAITGLVWVGFVFSHMVGNLLIFVGPEAYNIYSHTLISNPFIYVAEAVLVGCLVAHVYLAISLARQNRLARDSQYAFATNGEKSVSAASKTMIFHGSILLAFLVYHLITFKYGTYYAVQHKGVDMRDIHRLVVEKFQSPAYVMGYLFCMVAVGAHLSHGVASIFKSWGFNHPQYTPWIERGGMIYAAVVAVGFMAQPIYVYWQGV